VGGIRTSVTATSGRIRSTSRKSPSLSAARATTSKPADSSRSETPSRISAESSATTIRSLRLLDGGEERCGYLLKDRVLDSGQLADAVRRVGEGGVVVDPELVTRLVGKSRPDSPLDELTAREREVLALMAEGLADRGIGERLFVTPKTVETHVRHIFAKLGLPETAADNKRVHAVLTYLRA
jgi:DNA-binding NarL/FixJ family response regulator